jgi:hypothetical protein
MKFEVHKEELQKQFPEINFKKEYYIFKGEKKDSTRTPTQNNSLYLFFKQVSDQCLEKGIDMREIVKDNVEIECTPENIKWIWLKLQYFLFKTKSTKQLKNNGQIDIIYRNFTKIVSERTQGEVIVPPFPCEEVLAKKRPEIDYPENNLGEIPF